MTACIRSQIGDAIAAALANVTQANGYELTFGDVLRPTQRGLAKAPENLQPVLEQGDGMRVSPEGLGMEEWDWNWTVTVPVIQSELDQTPYDELLNAADSCARKALYADRKLGLLTVSDVQCGPPVEAVAADGTWEGFSIEVMVRYRTAENDPYTAA